jgi:HTH-type transcriptional regulator/antitoxin HigA
MSTNPPFDQRKYGRLLAKVLPVKIETVEEYDRLVGETDKLMEKEEDSLSLEEERLLDLLAGLIEQYDGTHYPLPQTNPHEMLHYLMEQRELKQRDLLPMFGGSRGLTSEVVSGKRAVSKAQAKKLAEFFHVSVEVFI